MSALTDEIAQLCRLILSYQKRVGPIRQKMFNNSCITDDYVWGYMFSDYVKQIESSHIYNFLHKHGKPVNKQNCVVVCNRYSSLRNGKLSKDNFWQIFHPKTIKHADSIIKTRKQKNQYQKNFEISYILKDCIIDILEQTLIYESVAEKMKQNIEKERAKQQQTQYFLSKIQPKYLQMYLIDSAPQIRLSDCQTILQHIFGHTVHFDKNFYSFFHPQHYVSSSSNPYQKIIEIQQNQSLMGANFYARSKDLWRYGRNYCKNNKPLYLK